MTQQIDVHHVGSTVSQHVQQLTSTIAQHHDQKLRQEFEQTMINFERMHKRFLQALNNPEAHSIQWERVESPTEQTVLNYESQVHSKYAAKIAQDDAYVKQLLSKLVVLKLNGGLGTTMGCTGPKSVIPVRGDDTFLDLTIKQIEALNNKYQVNIPLVLMNSFNTDADTAKILPNYTVGRNVRVLTFNQKQFPRIHAHEFTPIPKTADPQKTDMGDWYPPGHGDIYDSFYRSGLYEQLIQEGREYMFMSNVDNLGAVVDLNIVAYLIENQTDFCMEVTRKTLADVKGGTLIRYRLNDDSEVVKLLEIAQVPDRYVNEFKSIEKFKIFNTNNLWIRLKAIEEKLDALIDNIEIINNRKEKDGIPVIQMETAAGAAIQVFKKALGIEVPRSRFLPVKTCSDLLLIQSDVYDLSETGDNTLVINKKRAIKSAPMIELSDEFKKVGDFNARFPSIPSLIDCNSLIVNGDVRFGRNVTVKGDVKIEAAKGKSIVVEDNRVLDNEVVRAE